MSKVFSYLQITRKQSVSPCCCALSSFLWSCALITCSIGNQLKNRGTSHWDKLVFSSRTEETSSPPSEEPGNQITAKWGAAGLSDYLTNDYTSTALVRIPHGKHVD